MKSTAQVTGLVSARGAFIDKLAITFDIPAQYEGHLAQRLQLLMQDKVATYCPSRNYKTGVRIWLNDHLIKENATSSCMTIHAFPKVAGYRTCRVEWNPDKIAIHDIAVIAFGDFLELDFAMVNSGVVTGLDLAVDISNAKINDFVFHVPKFQLFRNYYGSGTTRYLGGNAGSRYFCCYDKRAEIIQHNKKVNFRHVVPVPEYPLMRIEARLRPLKLAWKALGCVDNPFESLKIWHFLTDYPSHESADPIVKLVLSLAQYTGLNSALHHLGKHQRKATLIQLQKMKQDCDWWNPSKFWSGFQKKYHEIDSEMMNG